VFDPAAHLPQSALECLVLAGEHAPGELDVYRDIARILATESGWDGLRIKALSHLSLHDRRDWRLGLELGLADCRAFRVREGLEEILAARGEARRQGQSGRFERFLAARDGSGRIRALLGDDFSATNPPS
jgi:hypothetical protein